MDLDLLVIGGGSGGVRCARIAASLGARVALVEEKEMGGTCVNLGCVPKKLWVHASRVSRLIDDAQGLGWNTQQVPLDWSRLLANKNREIHRLNKIYEGLLERVGVQIIPGRARFIGPNSVEVNGRTWQAKNILIATGSRPHRPNVPGIEHTITSDEAFHLPSLPPRIVLLGGGYIATEFAGIFQGLNAQVSQVYRGELFLRGFDVDCRNVLADEMRKLGIDLRFGVDITQIERSEDEYTVRLSDGTALACDLVMGALGRRPNTDGLGLDSAGVDCSPTGAVVVNDQFETKQVGIYAIGDVIDTPQLTPVALAQGTKLAHHLFGDADAGLSFTEIPTAVFSPPPLSSVGMTEAEARDQLAGVTIYESRFTPMHHHLTGRQTKTYMKLVVEDGTDRVVGCHMVGAGSPEIIQSLAVAVTCGATKAHFDHTLGIHPTAAEEFVTMRTPRAPLGA